MNSRNINIILVIFIGIISTFLLFMGMRVFQKYPSSEITTEQGSTIVQRSVKVQVIPQTPIEIEKEESAGEISEERVNMAIARAIDFLSGTQLPHGEFMTRCEIDGNRECSRPGSPFVTAHILYALQEIESEKGARIKEKATDFLLDKERQGGVWSFNDILPADSNTTSFVSFALSLNKAIFQNNEEKLLANRDEKGMFKTWFPNNKKEHQMIFARKEDADCVVNANVLLYASIQNSLHSNSITAPVCTYVNRVITDGQSCSSFYLSPIALYYSVSHALERGISCLEQSRQGMIQGILNASTDTTGSFGNDLEHALALNTLLVLGYKGDAVQKAANYLFHSQNLDGSWDEKIFFADFNAYVKYFSSELTTAFAVQALDLYRKNIIKYDQR